MALHVIHTVKGILDLAEGDDPDSGQVCKFDMERVSPDNKDPLGHFIVSAGIKKYKEIYKVL